MSENVPELTDGSPMPFGKHRNKKMKDVPASWLHWFWMQTHDGCDHVYGVAVRRYIRANLSALKKEHPDGIWKEKNQ